MGPDESFVLEVSEIRRPVVHIRRQNGREKPAIGVEIVFPLFLKRKVALHLKQPHI